MWAEFERSVEIIWVSSHFVCVFGVDLVLSSVLLSDCLFEFIQQEVLRSVLLLGVRRCWFNCFVPVLRRVDLEESL